MKKHWLKSTIALLSILFILAACGNDDKDEPVVPQSDKEDQSEETDSDTSAAEEKQTFKVGVTQIVEHPSLNEAFNGFKQALEDAGLDIDYDIQNAQNDNNANVTIGTNLANSDADLIFANSTPSTQAVVSATQDIPIVFTSITDAVGAELVASMEEPGGNVTGTIDAHPDSIPNAMTFLNEELGAEKVGVVYNTGEQNSVVQIERIREKAEELGMTVVEATVSTSADVKQAIDSLVGKVDSIFSIQDNTTISAFETIIEVAQTNELPLMVAELDSVKRGGLAAFGFEYYDLGYETGEMAVQILKGEKEPATFPVQVPKELKFVVNKEAADKLGIEIKDEWNAELYE